VSHEDLVSHYEVLRGLVLREETSRCGALGWGVLVRRGMSSWMLSFTSWGRSVCEEEREKDGGPIDAALPTEKAELVKVLAYMVLHHGKEESLGHTKRS